MKLARPFRCLGHVLSPRYEKCLLVFLVCHENKDVGQVGRAREGKGRVEYAWIPPVR